MAHKSTQTGTAKRSLAVLCAFMLFAGYLLFVLFRMQIIEYDEYQSKVIDQITVETSVGASRGKIYDANGTLLATNTTTWRVFISPVDIQAAKYGTLIEKLAIRRRYGMDAQAAAAGMAQDELIAKGLSEILGVDYDTVMQKAALKGRRDETIKKNVDKETVDRVLAFVQKNGLSSQVHCAAVSTRYYCYDNLASSVIGFTGTDGQGLYGLELEYDDRLTGTDGKYITAKDANGSDMPSEYETYIEAENGENLISTVNLRIQYALETQLEATFADSAPTNRVCGIVMDVKTGGILAMSVKPDFDLNSPFTLSDYYSSLLVLSGYEEGSSEYNTFKKELQLLMWNNKNITEIYEPGSTFKIITSAMALEEKVVDINEMFYCSGSYYVEGYSSPIHCHKVEGHGSLSFARGLQQSCNPVLMTVVGRLGTELFYKYFEAFGYLDKTGIDLPGEAVSYFHSYNSFHAVELAVASFGQRFKVTPLQQLTAIAAVANGGYLVTPHLYSGFTDDDGNVLSSYETEVKRQVVSTETCKTLTAILEEGVSGDGGAKNAYVKGYKVAAKTGTSQKFDVLDADGNSYLRIGSCVAFAPADDPQIAVIIIVDEPTCLNQYGSIVAAPYVSKLLGTILPYLGIEPQYTDEELATMEMNVSLYKGMNPQDAKKAIQYLGMKCEIVGDGDTVITQMPPAGSAISKNTGKIILYTGSELPKNSVSVPSVVGKTAAAANQILVNAGLNIRIEGAQNYSSGTGAMVISQSIAEGEKVAPGTVVTIDLRHMDSTD